MTKTPNPLASTKLLQNLQERIEIAPFSGKHFHWLMSVSKKNTPSKGGGPEETTLPSLLVDLGKAKRSRVRNLKRGKGRLMDKVESAIDETIDELGAEAGGKTILPVVVIVERRPKKRKGNSILDLAFPSTD